MMTQVNGQKTVSSEANEILEALGVDWRDFTKGDVAARTPITSELIGRIPGTSRPEADATIRA